MSRRQAPHGHPKRDLHQGEARQRQHHDERGQAAIRLANRRIDGARRLVYLDRVGAGACIGDEQSGAIRCGRARPRGPVSRRRQPGRRRADAGCHDRPRIRAPYTDTLEVANDERIHDRLCARPNVVGYCGAGRERLEQAAQRRGSHGSGAASGGAFVRPPNERRAEYHQQEGDQRDDQEAGHGKPRIDSRTGVLAHLASVNLSHHPQQWSSACIGFEARKL